VELVIESLAAGGDGVGRAADGRVVFVPFTAPGDRVRVRLVEVRARFARGRVETLLRAGPDRVDPVCPVFGSCGGCAWQHVRYAAQLDAKVRIVEDALARIGGLAFSGEIERVASPRAYGTRSRTRLLRRDGRTGYRRRRSRALQAVTRCPALAPDVDAALHALAARPSAPQAGEQEWEIAQGDAAPRVVQLPGGDGDPIELTLAGDRLRISPGVFFQAHAELREALARAVVEAAGRGERAVEIFAGAGFFTLGLARAFGEVTAVESSPAAVSDLRENLRRADLDRVRVLPERLESVLARLPRCDALVLDPPRAGLPAGSVQTLAGLGAARVVYLSCDPATLARDLAGFAACGLRVDRVVVFDLFPQTPHVETLVRLRPGRGPLPAGLVHSPPGDC
jgi:23S rRNA (uracil1939-C5)-methyltransferase